MVAGGQDLGRWAVARARLQGLAGKRASSTQARGRALVPPWEGWVDPVGSGSPALGRRPLPHHELQTKQRLLGWIYGFPLVGSRAGRPSSGLLAETIHVQDVAWLRWAEPGLLGDS